MERSLICPTCLSQHLLIHGLIYAPGSYEGRQCTDSWHDGAKYDELRLTPEDKVWLAAQYIGF